MRIRTLSLLLLPLLANAQNQHIAYPNVEVKTPKATALDAYNDIPVSYYTGIPDISIPIYEIDVDGFKLPITLSYHSSGIRVNQEATWVGLGWTLNAGGTITRQVMAADDFLENYTDWSHPWMRTGFYDGPVYTTNYDSLYEIVGIGGGPTWWDTESRLISDPEPDIFSYTIPGYSGKFIFNNSKQPVLFSRNHNIRVEVIRESGSRATTLKLTDGEGNQYFFNDKEVSLNYFSNQYLYKNTPATNTVYDDDPSTYVTWEFNEVLANDGFDGWEAAPCVPYEMTSSWCLTQITTNKGRQITFTYENEEESLPAQESSEIYNTDIYGRDQHFYHSKLINRGKRLAKITWDAGSVTFNASSREDIKGTAKKLDQILVKNINGNVLKNYTFNYSYFNNDYSGNSAYTHVFKRLKLTGLSETSFSPSPGYTFNYYEGSFPAKNSKNTDYWGLQNGRTYGQEYCVGLIVNNRVYPGVSKEADFDHAVIGSLRQITYPTGGYARFTYENNQYGGGIGLAVNNDMGSDGAQGTPSSGTSFQLAVYNNYVANEHPDLPETDTLRFRILTASTRMAINYNMENHVCNYKDPNYNYCVDALLALYKISDSGTRTLLYIKECPYLFEISGTGGISDVGEGCEEAGQIGRSLDAGKYELVATRPPKDVCTEWNVSFNYVMKQLDANYNDITPLIQPSADNGGAGLRIAKIETDATTRTFRYPTGTMMRTPVLYYFGRRPGYSPTTPQAFIQASESKSTLSTFGLGNFVGYDWVEERLESYNDTIRTRYYYVNEPEDEQYDDNHADCPYLINYMNGLLTKKETYRNNALWKEEIMTYSHTTNNRIYTFRDKSEHRLSDYMFSYYYDIEWPMTATSSETIHENGGTITSSQSFTYNSRDLLMTQSQTVSGDVIQSIMKYPFDMQDAVSVSMTAANHIVSPTEILKSVNGSIVDGEKLVYSQSGSLFVPSILYNLYNETGLPLSQYASAYGQKMRFNSYTAHGNPQETWLNNEVTTFLWSYNGLYPIAEIKNATYQQVKNILGESTINSFYSSWPTDSQITSFLAPLRNAASQSHFLITSYTYKPLYGVTSVTQPSGTKNFFEYDSHGRLSSHKDTDNNVRQQYIYHYHAQ